MCGEHLLALHVQEPLSGSSPHVRGARWSRWPDASRCGIIPACAGSTMLPARCPVRARDHPRMCGEHKDVTTEQIVQAGSSPHVRGAPEVTAGNSRTNGIIPACAGSTGGQSPVFVKRWDHPRMCGEHAVDTANGNAQAGSSPHVRGARSVNFFYFRRVGIIPACAGSTSRASCSTPFARDHPRMCGEHALGNPNAKTFEGSSPHVRGARLLPRNLRSPPGIIPACAGSTDRGGESIL